MELEMCFVIQHSLAPDTNQPFFVLQNKSAARIFLLRHQFFFRKSMTLRDPVRSMKSPRDVTAPILFSTSPGGGLFVPDANGINLADSQSDLGQSRSGSVMDRDPSKESGHQQDVEEMIEVKF